MCAITSACVGNSVIPLLRSNAQRFLRTPDSDARHKRIAWVDVRAFLFFVVNLVYALLIPSISVAQQASQPRISGRVVAIEEISAKETRLTLAIPAASGEQRRQFRIDGNTRVTGAAMLGGQAEVDYWTPRPSISQRLLHIPPPLLQPPVVE